VRGILRRAKSLLVGLLRERGIPPTSGQGCQYSGDGNSRKFLASTFNKI
jgi:hypothetical protein